MGDFAVLVMAYGTPADLTEVEAYYTDIRHGRPPPPEQVEELIARYRAIGGKSPLLEISRAQTRGLQERLGVPCFLGQKHAAPFIKDALAAAAATGADRLVGLVLAPHYSAMSIGDYERRARRAAAEVGWTGTFDMIQSWHTEPGYIAFLAREIRAARRRLPSPHESRNRHTVLFTAHSLPARILQANDPYPEQLRTTAELVARAAEVAEWRIAWQSAGRTADAWLGPDITEVVPELARNSVTELVVCPCGFVADHLEVLYDVDIEAKQVAELVGVSLVRTRAPNDNPEFLDALAAVVRRTLADRR